MVSISPILRIQLKPDVLIIISLLHIPLLHQLTHINGLHNTMYLLKVNAFKKICINLRFILILNIKFIFCK